jgi:CRP-like cAMP-binding protein
MNPQREKTMIETAKEFGIAGIKKYYSIGEIITKMGDPADAWYILLTGKVGVFKRDFSVAEISERGTVFGELGCLLNIPRTATLQALEPTSVLYVQMSMDEVVEKYPQFAKRILISLAERLAKTTDAWWASAQQKQ